MFKRFWSIFSLGAPASCRFQIDLCILLCVISREFTREAVMKFLPAPFSWNWCKCLLRSLIHSKISNLTKYREVLVKYSLLEMPLRIWHQLREGRMEKPESGIRNRSRNRNLNWDHGKLGSTETSSRYPCGNKIQDGVLCYHCFEKFSAQWSWYQRYTLVREVTCKKKVSASYCYS